MRYNVELAEASGGTMERALPEELKKGQKKWIQLGVHYILVDASCKHVRTEFFSKVCFYITFGLRCTQESFHMSSNEERRLRDCKFFSKVCFYITFGLRCAQDTSHVCSNEERRLRDYNLFIFASTFSIVCFVLPEWFSHWNKACFAKHRPRNSLPWAATYLLHVHGRKKSSLERTTTLTIVRTWEGLTAEQVPHQQHLYLFLTPHDCRQYYYYQTWLATSRHFNNWILNFAAALSSSTGKFVRVTRLVGNWITIMAGRDNEIEIHGWNLWMLLQYLATCNCHILELENYKGWFEWLED